MGLMELLHASVIWINWILTKTQHATGRRRHHMSHGLQSANKHRFTGSVNLAALSYCSSVYQRSSELSKAARFTEFYSTWLISSVPEQQKMLLSQRPSKSLWALHCCILFPQRPQGICEAVKRDVQAHLLSQIPHLPFIGEKEVGSVCVQKWRHLPSEMNVSVGPLFWWLKYNHELISWVLLNSLKHHSAQFESFKGEV